MVFDIIIINFLCAYLVSKIYLKETINIVAAWLSNRFQVGEEFEEVNGVTCPHYCLQLHVSRESLSVAGDCANCWLFDAFINFIKMLVILLDYIEIIV